MIMSCRKRNNAPGMALPAALVLAMVLMSSVSCATATHHPATGESECSLYSGPPVAFFLILEREAALAIHHYVDTVTYAASVDWVRERTVHAVAKHSQP